MLNDLVEIENELRSVLQEKHRIQKHICAIQQHIGRDEKWLSINHPGAVDSQETLEELLALQTYVVELHAQTASFEEVALELGITREHWQNPDNTG